MRGKQFNAEQMIGILQERLRHFRRDPPYGAISVDVQRRSPTGFATRASLTTSRSHPGMLFGEDHSEDGQLTQRRYSRLSLQWLAIEDRSSPICADTGTIAFFGPDGRQSPQLLSRTDPLHQWPVFRRRKGLAEQTRHMGIDGPPPRPDNSLVLHHLHWRIHAVAVHPRRSVRYVRPSSTT